MAKQEDLREEMRRGWLKTACEQPTDAQALVAYIQLSGFRTLDLVGFKELCRAKGVTAPSEQRGTEGSRMKSQGSPRGRGNDPRGKGRK